MGDLPYRKIVFAGTFDRLHEGHKHLLRTALKLGDKVTIGLTSDEMVSRRKGTKNIKDFSKRWSDLEEFLKIETNGDRFELFEITTVEGGADTMLDLDALLVSDEISVVENAFRINDLREQNGLRRFHIIIVPRVRTDDGRPLSSSRIRKGEHFEGKKFIY